MRFYRRVELTELDSQRLGRVMRYLQNWGEKKKKKGRKRGSARGLERARRYTSVPYNFECASAGKRRKRRGKKKAEPHSQTARRPSSRFYSPRSLKYHKVKKKGDRGKNKLHSKEGGGGKKTRGVVQNNLLVGHFQRLPDMRSFGC